MPRNRRNWNVGVKARAVGRRERFKLSRILRKNVVGIRRDACLKVFVSIDLVYVVVGDEVLVVGKELG